MNNDASPNQVVANGTCNGVTGAMTFTATGAKVTTSGAGLYLITLDPGLPGSEFVDNAHSRCIVSGLTGANPNVQIVKNAGGDQYALIIVSANTGAVLDACGFDFVILKDSGN